MSLIYVQITCGDVGTRKPCSIVFICDVFLSCIYAKLLPALYHIHLTVTETKNPVPGPTLTFGFVIATLLGASCHLVFGGDARRLAMLLLAGWLGFVLGQLVGDILDFGLFDVVNIGPLNMLPAVIGAIIALIFTLIVTGRQSNRRSSRK